MKTTVLRHSALGLVAVALFTALPQPVFSQSMAAVSPIPQQPANKPSTNVSGRVEAKSDNSLSVSGRTVSLTSATTYSRRGASIGSADIKVGDVVNVVTSNDGQVAVSVACTD